MKNLYLIVGETASGKDTLADMLCKDMKFEKVVSYTDAPIRSDQKNGREHYFVSKEEFDLILQEQSVIAYTQIGNTGFRYCATMESFHENTRVYIIDPNGIRDMKYGNLKGYRPVIIFIDADEKIRAARASHRKNFDYEARKKRESTQFEEFRRSKGYDYSIANNKTKDIAYRILKKIVETEESGN